MDAKVIRISHYYSADTSDLISALVEAYWPLNCITICQVSLTKNKENLTSCITLLSCGCSLSPQLQYSFQHLKAALDHILPLPPLWQSRHLLKKNVSSLYYKDYEHVWCWHGGGHSSIANAAGLKTAGIRALENSISINAGFKARLDTAVSVSSSSGKTEVLKLSPKGTRGLAAQSIHESPLCFSAFSTPLSTLSSPPPSLAVCHVCSSTAGSADQTQADQSFAGVLQGREMEEPPCWAL